MNIVVSAYSFWAVFIKGVGVKYVLCKESAEARLGGMIEGDDMRADLSSDLCLWAPSCSLPLMHTTELINGSWTV